jgi:hypothetical protein
VHHANHFYGHAHVLASYCGLDQEFPPRIHGYLQHGWNIGDALAPGTPYVTGAPLFVWSEQTRRRAVSLGRRNAVVVGAPWNYLLTRQPAGADDQPRTGTIWYPFHGWEEQRLRGDHRRLIDEIKATEPGPVTVCLYWHEYRNRRIRRRYERTGFRVICHGYRGQWWRDTDPEFLPRQLAALRSHRRVASNRLTTAVFYGILAGCDPAVYGDPMALRREDTVHGGPARLRRQWPELHGAAPDVRGGREIAAAELGAAYLAPPAELRQMFGWLAPGVPHRPPARVTVPRPRTGALRHG